MKKQKYYGLFVCILGITGLAGSTLTFAGGASSRLSANDQYPDTLEGENYKEYYKVVFKKGKYKFANPELKKGNNLVESTWKIHASRLGVTRVEFNKINNGHYTAYEILLGIAIYKQYEKTLLENTHSDEDRLLMLVQSANYGSETAIDALFDYFTITKLNNSAALH